MSYTDPEYEAYEWLTAHTLLVGHLDGYAFCLWPWGERRYLWSRRGSWRDLVRACQDQERLYREGLC